MKTRLFVILLTFLMTGISPAQRSLEMPESRRRTMFGHELFKYRHYNFADTTNREQTRVDFHFSVVNDVLSFVTEENGRFKARYEISVIIYDDDGFALAEKTLNHRLLVDDYQQTNSRRAPHTHSFSMRIKPGLYDALIQLTDLESEEAIRHEKELQVRNLNTDRVHISDPIFVNRLNILNDSVVYKPNLSNVFSDINSEFAAYFEFYPQPGSTAAGAQITITNGDGDTVHSEGRTYSVKDTGLIIRESIGFREYLTKPDKYTLAIEFQADDQKTKIQRAFQVFWGNRPLEANNLNLAIEQLALVANRSTVDSMREANGEEKERLFQEFWKKRDPTPNTDRNELRAEFFRRVDFANENFTEISSGRMGWRTDRGRIYIKYGPPDQVDRQRSQINTPGSEVWTYGKLSRKYFFLDRNNDGVYRLVKIE